ncbi:MAG: ComEA family DNA-binding protein [Dehalococcoidia bacterium]
MKRPHSNSNNTIILFILAIIIAGGVATLFQLHPWAGEPVEIILPEVKAPISDATEIYVGGAVINPGWYPTDKDAAINDVIALAGGPADGGEVNAIKLYVPDINESARPQLISINRADAWLLDALPGIGPTTAQKIVDYREANGPFVTIYELMLVPGIGESSFNRVKELITVE